jgi:hypothetical protein
MSNTSFRKKSSQQKNPFLYHQEMGFKISIPFLRERELESKSLTGYYQNGGWCQEEYPPMGSGYS